MGVLGLWQLLAPVGQPVTLESLENKIFAVDISIWLNQAVKGYRDSTGGSVANAHLLSLFSRLCKLLFYRIRPIIVFDGGFPELKKQTIINRQKRRAALKHNSREAGLKLLTNYLASQQLGQGNGSTSGSIGGIRPKEKPRDEIFKLPPLPNDLQETLESQEDEVEKKFSNFSKEDIKYLNQIDLDSEDFHNLPPDLKLEILSTLKESRRHKTWEQFEELPKESNDFSKYQMQALLKKRRLQSKLEQVQSDLRKINSSAYVAQYTSDHVIGETNKIMSDDSSYYVLLKKISENEGGSKNKSVDGTSVMNDAKNAFIRDLENIDMEDSYFKKEEDDLKTAIMNSLSDVKKEENEDYLTDDEFAVDNPPVFDSKDNYLENKNSTVLMSSTSIKHSSRGASFSSDQSLAETDQDSKTSSPKYDNKSELSDNIVTNPDDETFQKQIPKEIGISDHNCTNRTNAVEISEEIKIVEEPKKQVLDELVIVSSDDEMISCDDDVIGDELIAVENTVSNENTSKNSQKEDVLNLDPYQSSDKVSETLINADIVSDLPSMSLNYPSASTSNSQLTSEVNSRSTPNRMNTSSDLDDGTSERSQRFVNEHLQEANLELQKELEAAASMLQAEQNKQDRQARTVQDHMIEECKELLQLFGIPYIVSPLEAEAQCAFYDKVELTNGTITDDSDVWLFGGKRVYKNFFTQQKFVERYKDNEIFHHFGLSREKLINFALLTGSDYTEGIEGVGAVTAMEIISEFPGEGIDALKKFKDWWDVSNRLTKMPENKVRAKLKKLVLMDNFPDENVFNAYLNPEVDSSKEKFSWGRPDLDALREYTKERFGWNQSKVDDMLLPVIKKLNERNSQTHIDSFFSVTLRKEKNLFPSKRIMSALKKITSPEKAEAETAVKHKASKRKARTANKKVKKSATAAVRKPSKSQGPNLSESSSESDY